MPRIKKFAPKLTTNLTNIQTFIVDGVYDSEYFKLTEFKNTFTGGKNGFLIEGSPFLKETTEVKLEILDANGNPVYYEIAKGNPQYYESTSILVAVYIYNDTPVGPAKITILGEAKTYNDNGVTRNIPDEWVGVYNVKWEREFKINRTLPNIDRVRFTYRPEIEVTELSGSTFIAQIEEIIQYGTGSGYAVTPDIGTVMSNKYYGDVLYKIITTGSSVTETPQNEFWVDVPSELVKKKKTNNYRYYQVFKCDGNDVEDPLSANYYLSEAASNQIVSEYGLLIGGLRLFDDSDGSYYIISGPVEGLAPTNTVLLSGPFTTQISETTGLPRAQCDGLGTPIQVQALLGNIEEEPYVPFTSSILVTQDAVSKFPGQSILAPKITIPSANIYDEEVFQFLSDTELLIKKPYTVDGKVSEFDLFEYTMSYNSITNFTESAELSSYAQFTINNLNTYVGDVARVKVFYKPTRTITDFELLDDLRVESVELLRELFSGSYIEYGKFTGSIEPYWVTSSNEDYSFDITGEKVFGGVAIEQLSPTTESFTLQTSESFNLNRDEEYIFYTNIQYTGDITSNTYFKAYISGSSDFSGSIQPIVTLNPVKQNKNQQRLEQNFIVRESGDYNLIIEVVGDRWDFGGISLKSAEDDSFSPDYYEFNLPVTRNKPVEYFDFKFEFYDINNNYIPADLFANRVEFKEGSGSVNVKYDEVLDALSDLQDDIDALTTDVLTKPIYKYGEILFGTGTTIISQSADLYWDIPNRRLGIGRKDPQYDVDISGSVRITEDLIVEGRITAQEFYTEYVTASVIFESGSTKFGDSSDDTHVFTGSLTLQGDESIDGFLYVNELPMYQQQLNDMFTGVVSGGIITFNGQVFNISSGSGYIVDNYTDPINPTYQYVTWPNYSITASAFPGTGLNATTPRTNIAINPNGSVYQQTNKFTPIDYREKIVLGRIAHTNSNVITRALSLPLTTYNRGFHWFDLANSIGPINVNGNVYSAGGTDLTIQKSAGQTYRVGSNYRNDTTFPDITTDILSNPTDFRYRYRNGSGQFIEESLSTQITGSRYDNGSGTLQVVNNNQWTVQRIFFFGATRTTIIQFGQNVYNSKLDAELSAFNETFETDPNLLDDSIFRAYLLIRGGATNLSNLNDGEFIEAAVGSSSGGGTVNIPITTYVGIDPIVVSASVDNNDDITVTVSHTESGVIAGTYNSLTVDVYGHVISGSIEPSGQTIQDSGSDMPQQENLNFIRMIVEDDTTNNATIVKRPPSVIVSGSAPTEDLMEGDEWIHNETWKKYVRYDDYWVETGKVDCSTLLVTGGGSSNPPVDESYTTQSIMISSQSSQLSNYIYHDGDTYWEYLGTTNGDITDYREIGGGGVDLYFEKTYSELSALSQSADLVPGATYLITDYQTIHLILNTTDINTGTVEPLLVKALSPTEIDKRATSTLFPDDIIEYDFANNLAEDNATPTKGLITFRHDLVRNVSCFYDWRQVKFRRWQLSAKRQEEAIAISSTELQITPTYFTLSASTFNANARKVHTQTLVGLTHSAGSITLTITNGTNTFTRPLVKANGSAVWTTNELANRKGIIVNCNIRNVFVFFYDFVGYGNEVVGSTISPTPGPTFSVGDGIVYDVNPASYLDFLTFENAVPINVHLALRTQVNYNVGASRFNNNVFYGGISHTILGPHVTNNFFLGNVSMSTFEGEIINSLFTSNVVWSHLMECVFSYFGNMWHTDAFKGHTEYSTVYGGSFGYQFEQSINSCTILVLGYGGFFEGWLNSSFICITAASTSNTITNFRLSTALINTLLGQIDGNFVDIRTPLANRSFYQIEYNGFTTYTNALNMYNPATVPSGSVMNIVIDEAGNLVKTGFSNFSDVTQEGNTSLVVIKHPDGVAPEDSATVGQLEALESSLEATLNLRTFGIDIDGAGSVITTGIKGYAIIPYDCEILGWYIVADTVGSIEIDVWKAASIPNGTNSICGSDTPKLISVQENQNETLTEWSINVTSGDVVAFNVVSASTVTKVNLIIKTKITV